MQGTQRYGRTTARNATGRPGAETSRPSTSPAAVAAAAGNFGRKPEDLPWLYLDSAGVEFGPVSGWMMRDWLASGRFPVGMDLKVCDLTLADVSLGVPPTVRRCECVCVCLLKSLTAAAWMWTGGDPGFLRMRPQT